MSSTKGSPSLIITFRRAEMTAFWILTTAGLCAGLVCVSWALGAGAAPWIWAAGLGLLLPGAVWTPWFEIGVRAWNKGVRVSLPILRAYVLGVAYYLLVCPVGWAGSALDLSFGTRKSRWIPRDPHEVQEDTATSEVKSLPHMLDGVRRSPIPWRESGLMTLVLNSEKALTLSLLPVVVLLRILSADEHDSGLPHGTYTLY